ncbi:hypothetical protein AVEN_272881-1 [Araneus ventricosus]|uniref:Uncharacterized protein n=1 Tax=Araneus ventricosus TaxID=182803 RepID=A0A4Y2QW87_ARAVE|nr:hypothetical protein AVEN_87781-1 [Araneus ventricosus]GBN81442.1 hypothetical protein AVEN_272881-1 [Araneus ventricosus]
MDGNLSGWTTNTDTIRLVTREWEFLFPEIGFPFHTVTTNLRNKDTGFFFYQELKNSCLLLEGMTNGICGKISGHITVESQLWDINRECDRGYLKTSMNRKEKKEGKKVEKQKNIIYFY